MKFRLVGDYESEDGFVSRGITVDEFDTREEAVESIEEHNQSYTSGYSNFSIYEIKEEATKWNIA